MGAESVTVAGSVVPGTVLLRPQWLAERISDMGISWGTGDLRVSGTLWWCMAASSLVDPIATAYARGRDALDPELERIRCEVRPDGGIERVTAAEGAARVEDGAAGPALRRTLDRVIPLVAEVCGASVASLWAIVADAIGNRSIDSGNAQVGERLAEEVAGRLPMPRFADVGGRRFVRRISCCLVFEVQGCQMCTSCPKRPAAERDALLAEAARRG